MEWAAHIAELRLWLTLIIDTHISAAELHVRRDPLLPHLTFKVRYGDSLVQEVGGLNLGHMQTTSDISSVLKRRLSWLKDKSSLLERSYKTLIVMILILSFLTRLIFLR